MIAKIYAQPCARSGPQSGLVLWTITTILILSLAALPLPAREKDAVQYGMGLIMNIPFPEAEVEQVVQDIVQNGIIRGTKEYNKDEYVSDATPATSTRVFPPWTEEGKVFYKVRLHALDPRNFKNSGDVGTLAVRYVVKAQDAKNTILRIDAVFVEDFRRTSHPSNGSVESAEFKDIHDHLDAMASMKAETVEAEKVKQEYSTKTQTPAMTDETPAPVVPSASANTANVDAKSTANESTPRQATGSQTLEAQTVAPQTAAPQTAAPQTAAPQTGEDQTLEQRVQELKRQVQRLVKAPGAPLQSAPFHSASTLQSLPPGAEVLIVISTPYWVGVETHEGQHGWIMRDQLEQLP